MKIINQSYHIETDKLYLIKLPLIIEKAARTCYKSEDKITPESSLNLCKNLIKKGHEAMLEHGNITVRFITDRGVTHELVRHRIGTAFAQESTRYVKYGNDIEFIKPVFDWAKNINNDGSVFGNNQKAELWTTSMLFLSKMYMRLIDNGCKPQEARAVLPNSLKTEIVVTANIREWRHIFKLRTANTAHPQIKELMISLLNELQWRVPVLFDDIGIN